MTTIEIKSLEFQNFKSFNRRFDFSPGKNILVGDNETGKTTLADGPLWLFDGKDSQNKAAFEIKPIVDGEPLHNADYSVTAEFKVDGEDQAALNRTLNESWTKPRKAKQKQLTGHKTSFYVGGESVNPSSFQETIKSVYRSEVYKLVTDPGYFVSLPVKERRDILTDVAGLTFEEIEAAKGSIKGFKKLLGNRDIEQAKATFKKRKKQIDDGGELTTIPANLELLKSQIDSAGNGRTVEQLESDLKSAEAEVKKVEKEIAKVQSGDSGSNEKLKDLNQKLTAANSKFYAEKQKALDEWSKHQAEVSSTKREISVLEPDLKAAQDEVNSLRNQFFEVREEKQIIDETCFNCGQEMPPGMLQDSESKFNAQKAKRLQEIQEKGKAADKKRCELERALEDRKSVLVELSKKEQPAICNRDRSKESLVIGAEIDKLNAAKEETEIPEELTEKLEAAQNVLKTAQDSKSRFDMVEDSRMQFNELTDTHKKLTTEYEQIESFFDYCLEFDQKIAELTEQKVNNMFKVARFRMFRKQMNGDLDFRCDILGPNGDDFHTNVNTGTRIKIGLDIIKVLQSHYDLYAPVIIDNAESVSNIPEMDCQVIELYKCAWEKTLEPAFAVDWLGNYLSEKTYSTLDESHQAECTKL